MQLNLYPGQEYRFLLQVTNRPRISDKREKIYPFLVSASKTVNYFSTLFDEGLQYRTLNAH